MMLLVRSAMEEQIPRDELKIEGSALQNERHKTSEQGYRGSCCLMEEIESERVSNRGVERVNYEVLTIEAKYSCQ